MASVLYPSEILSPIKEHLEKKLVQLKERQAELLKEDPFADEGRLNDNAAADIEASEQFGHARIEAMRQETAVAIENTQAALDKIAKGTYGSCESCHQMIDTDRLAIDPAARFCMSCQQKHVDSSQA